MNKKNFMLLSLAAAIMLTMCALFLYYKHNTDRFLSLFQSYFMYAYAQDPLTSFCIFFVLHAPYHIFLLPGYTLFAIAAGFFLQDVLYTFCVLFAVNAVWTMLVYYLFKFSFKDFLYDLLREEAYYQVFEKKAQTQPLKVSLIIRFLYIPQIYKNFFLFFI